MAYPPRQEESSIASNLPLIKKSILGAVAFLLLIIFNPITCIGSGKRGVLTTFGSVSDRILGEGMHIIWPWQGVHSMSVMIRKFTVTNAEAASKDLQKVHSTITVNYHYAFDKVNWIYQNLSDPEETLIAPSIQEMIKASTAKHNAADLITNREIVKTEIETSLQEKLKPYNIVVDQVAIENFAFSEQFSQAIEAKQTAEQNALKAQRDLERIKVEADQKVATAQAEARAFQLQSQALTPQMIQMEWIKKWKGDVPTYSGSGGSFIFQMPHNN